MSLSMKPCHEIPARRAVLKWEGGDHVTKCGPITCSCSSAYNSPYTRTMVQQRLQDLCLGGMIWGRSNSQEFMHQGLGTGKREQSMQHTSNGAAARPCVLAAVAASRYCAIIAAAEAHLVLEGVRGGSERFSRVSSQDTGLDLKINGAEKFVCGVSRCGPANIGRSPQCDGQIRGRLVTTS